MYERSSQALLHRRAFVRRAARHALAGFGVVILVDGIGTIGYHLLAPLPWIDSFLNASMILGGMGPVDKLDKTPAKLFASFYALFSGLVFIAVLALILGPWLHRLLHTFHLEGKGK